MLFWRFNCRIYIYFPRIFQDYATQRYPTVSKVISK